MTIKTRKRRTRTTLQPDILWHRMSNKDIRRYVYEKNLALHIQHTLGKSVRSCSREELANFLEQNASAN